MVAFIRRFTRAVYNEQPLRLFLLRQLNTAKREILNPSS